MAQETSQRFVGHFLVSILVQLRALLHVVVAYPPRCRCGPWSVYSWWCWWFWWWWCCYWGWRYCIIV